MSSFSCPHVSGSDNFCIRLKKDCVPGRPGCVLGNRFQFAVPVEKRIAEKDNEKKIKSTNSLLKNKK